MWYTSNNQRVLLPQVCEKSGLSGVQFAKCATPKNTRERPVCVFRSVDLNACLYV